MAVETIYWDSDCFLGWFQEEAGKVDLCAGTIERAEQGEVLIMTSALTIAEVLWLRGGPRIPEDKATIIRRFFRRSYVRIRNVTRAVAEDAQELVWRNSIRPKDAIHVATALGVRANALETFDEFLLSQSGVRGLTIRKPIPPKQTKLL
jgi:predicted nucleic acid-binding protein